MATRRRGRLLAVGLLVVALLLIGLAATLAVPVPLWRSGDQGLAPLQADARVPVVDTARIWIDTDAACGHGDRTDPDDCLAIALLARTKGVHIAGVSTVFGNAPRPVVDATVAQLLRVLEQDTGRSVAAWPGAERANDGTAGPVTPAEEALTDALEAGPLVLVALGPLTNVAALLARRPDLAPRLRDVVAVMGRRPGHLFHPAEGAAAGSFLGHGPVFRDFNFALDPAAAQAVVARAPALTLVPYDAARQVEFGAADVAALAHSGAAGRWLAPRLHGWLGHWQQEIGRDGFLPFDLMAAALIAQPDTMRCAAVDAWVGRDTHLLLPGLRPTALLVAERGVSTSAGARAARYCAFVQDGFMPALRARLSAPPARPGRRANCAHRGARAATRRCPAAPPVRRPARR